MKKILYFLVILIIVAPIHLIEAQNSQKNKYKTSKIRDLALIYLISLSRMSLISLPTARKTGYSMAFCSSSLPMVKVIIMPMDMPKSRHEK